MNLLLDTHVWLWMLSSPQRLRDETRSLLGDEGNRLFLSAASSWEIAIKYRLGKLPLPEPPAAFIAPRLLRDGVTGLAVQHAHAVRVAELPDIHNDPFDRILIAQAQVENLVFVSADAHVFEYDVQLLKA